MELQGKTNIPGKRRMRPESPKVETPSRRQRRDFQSFYRYPSFPLALLRTTLAAILLTITLPLTGCQRATHNLEQPVQREWSKHKLNQGRDQLTRSEVASAESAFSDAVKHDPQNTAAQEEYARLCVAKGDFKNAVSHYRAALRSDPSNVKLALAYADSLCRQAEMALDRKQLLEAAIRSYTYARYLEPANLDATAGLARTLRLLNRKEAAIETLRQALAEIPKAAPLHLELAAIFYTQEDFTQSASEYKLAAENDPSSIEAHNGCGLSYLRLSRLKKVEASETRSLAMQHFRQSLEINPQQEAIRKLLQTLDSYPQTVVSLPETVQP